jgi:hypothetical protein
MRSLEAVLAGLLLAVLAVPRFGAAVADLPGRPVLEALERGQPVDEASRQRLAATAALSFAIVPTANAKRAEAAARPGDAMAQALALSPADPYGWLALARSEQSANALALSLRTGRWERELAHDRVAVAAHLLPHLDATTRGAVYEQIVWLWDLDPPRLLRALPPEAHWPLYRRALSNRPEALAAVARRVGMD